MFSFFKITPEKIDKWEQKRDGVNLKKALDDSDPQIRGRAAKALAYIGDLTALDQIIHMKVFSDIEYDITSALETYTALLFRVLENMTQGSRIGPEQEQFIKAVPSILIAIGEPGHEKVVSSLSDYNSNVRLVAAQVVGMGCIASGVDGVIKLLDDQQVKVQQMACAVLKNFGKDVVFKKILDYFEEHYYSTNNPRFIQSLNALGWEPDNEEKKLEYYVRLKSFDRLQPYGLKAVGALVSAFNYNDDDLRTQATNLLLSMGEDACGALNNKLKKCSNKEEIGVTHLLADMKHPFALKALMDNLTDPSGAIRENVGEALKTYGEEALTFLVSHLKQQKGNPPDDLLNLMADMDWKPQSKEEKLILAKVRKDWMGLVDCGKPGMDAILAAYEDMYYADKDLLIIDVLKKATIEMLPLLEMMSCDRDPTKENRLALFEALKALKSPNYQSILAVALSDLEEDVRLVASKELARLGDKKLSVCVKGNDQDFERLAMAGSGLAAQQMINHLHGSFNHDSRRQVAKALVRVAEKQPQLLISQWKSLSELMDGNHCDYHSDEDLDRSSDCDHADSNQDSGVDVTFPKHPPKGIKEVKSDF